MIQEMNDFASVVFDAVARPKIGCDVLIQRRSLNRMMRLRNHLTTPTHLGARLLL